MLQGGIANILARFLAEHPQVRVALDATNRRVDVVDEGLDIAIRVRRPPWEDSDLAMRAFGPDQMILVTASPKLITAHGEPRTLEDVARMPTLSMASADESSTWHFLDANEPAEMQRTRRASARTISSHCVAPHWREQVQSLSRFSSGYDMERGALVRLLPSLTAQAGIIHAVFPSRRGMVPAVRALLDFLAETIKSVRRRPS